MRLIHSKVSYRDFCYNVSEYSSSIKKKDLQCLCTHYISSYVLFHAFLLWDSFLCKLLRIDLMASYIFYTKEGQNMIKPTIER
jgi:hypothetical protein